MRNRFTVAFNGSYVALEDLMAQLLISRAFTRHGVEAAIELCCDILLNAPGVSAPAQWN
jgi:hypothetical protein